MLRIQKRTLVLLVISLFALAAISVSHNVFAADGESHTEEAHTDCDHDHEEESHAVEAACDCQDCVDDHDDHADHTAHDEDAHTDHEDHPEHDEEDAHADCDHEAENQDSQDDHVDHEGHAHGDEQIVVLDSESKALIGLRTTPAQSGSLDTTLRLTGKVGLNANRLAHIVPLTSGIVRQAAKNIGDHAAQGEILAWIESVELGQTKVRYLDIQAELGCCSTLLTRAQQIHDNTLKLIDTLKSNPTLGDLQQIEGLEMGANRSVLITAYAGYVSAKTVYEREKSLYEQKISSRQEYLDAENNLKKAEAEYMAAVDTVQFQVRQDLLEVASDQQRQEIALKGVERSLYVMGQTDEDIQVLNRLAQNPTGSETSAPVCPDPDCEDCKRKAALGKNTSVSHADFQRLGWYPLRAAFEGTVIDKHITIGERLSEETVAFTVADLETVWVDLAVFAKDLPLIAKGRKCTMTADHQIVEGEISFVSPVLDPTTRTATARVVVDNASGQLRPGLFVTAVLYGSADAEGLVIPAQAVQTVDGNPCVFVEEAEGYALRPVTVGRRNAEHVEIHGGLHDGENVVTQGAFDLKAKIVTSTLDSHAGHGH